MRGLLYKDLVLSRFALIFVTITNLIMYALCVIVGMTAEDGFNVIIAAGGVCYFTFFVINLVSVAFFRVDESRQWYHFVASTPQTLKGQIEGKYLFLLIVCLVNLFLCLVTDTLIRAVRGSADLPVLIFGFYFFCLRLLMNALEIPFIVRFGADRGFNLMLLFLGGVMLLVGIYALFGDISMFLGDDPMEILKKLFSTDVMIWVLALLPYAAVTLYYLSYRVSRRLAAKGVESYEQ